MSTPMSSVLGGLAVPGSPDEVGALSRELRKIADHVTDCKNQLSAAAGNVDWTGGAADAYRDKLGSLPEELEKVCVSYGEVSWALWSYEGSLRDLQARSNRAATRARDAQYRLDLVARAKRSGHHDPRLDAEEHAAHAQLNAARREAGNIYAAFQDAAGTCCKRILHAGRDGLHNSFGSAFERYIVHDAGGFLWDVGKAVVFPITDLADALVELAADPSWAALSRVLEDVTTILGVMAIFYPPLGIAALVVGGLLVGTELAQGEWKKAAVNTLFIGIGGVGRVASSASIVGGKSAALQAGRATAFRKGAQRVVVAPQLRELYGARAAAGMRPGRWATRPADSVFDLTSKYSLVRAGLRRPFRAAVDETHQLHAAFGTGGPVGAASQWWHDYTAFAPSKGAQQALQQGRPATVHLHTIALVDQKLGDLKTVSQGGWNAYNRYVHDRQAER
jgi:hypothetical protein